jgi:hypothetical protein
LLPGPSCFIAINLAGDNYITELHIFDATSNPDKKSEFGMKKVQRAARFVGCSFPTHTNFSHGDPPSAPLTLKYPTLIDGPCCRMHHFLRILHMSTDGPKLHRQGCQDYKIAAKSRW